MSDDDLMKNILGELSSPHTPVPPPQPMHPDEKAARDKAAMQALLGQKMGLGRALNDEELGVALAVAKHHQEQAMLIGGGGNARRVIVDDEDVGLGQIDNLKAPSRYIDEVDKYLLDKHKATNEAGGDEFYSRVHMRQNTKEALNEQAPFTRNNPLSILNGRLGGTAMMTSGDPAITVANWPGQDEETIPVTVLLGPVNTPLPTPLTTTTPARPYATLIFGTCGFSLSADVDIAQGCQFTVNCSSAQLKLQMPPIATDISAALTSLTLNLSGMLSFHSPGRPTTVTRTLYGHGFPTAAVVVVPPFARRLTIVPTSAQATAWSWSILDSTGSTLYSHSYALNSLPMDPFVLPGSAAVIQANYNSDPGGIAAINNMIAFVFDLAF